VCVRIDQDQRIELVKKPLTKSLRHGVRTRRIGFKKWWGA
jgi:hypothetical protein